MMSLFIQHIKEHPLDGCGLILLLPIFICVGSAYLFTLTVDQPARPWEIEINNFSTCYVTKSGSEFIPDHVFTEGFNEIYDCGDLTAPRETWLSIYWFRGDSRVALSWEQLNIESGTFISRLELPHNMNQLSAGEYRVEVRNSRVIIATATFEIVPGE